MIELEKLIIRDESFIVEARRKLQALARDLRFDSLRTARLAICASELSRYIYQYPEPVFIMGLERTGADTRLKLVFRCKKQRSEDDRLGPKIGRLLDSFKISYTDEGVEVLEGSKDIEDPDFELTREFVHFEKDKLLRLSKSEELIALMDQVRAEKIRAEEYKRLDQLKADFISTVSHELRTPLAITKLGINLVLNRTTGEINEKQKEVLGDAKNNIERLARMLDALLDISKIEAGQVEIKRELVDMAGLIRQVVSSFGLSLKEKHLELRVHVPKRPIDAFVDSDKIIQVLTNLIGNSIKFTYRGYIEISLQEREKEIACIVADTGAGIAEDNVPKVFLKFQQFGRVFGAGEKGTGLGLAITKEIVELHGGKISMETKFGQGTRVSFILPKYTAEDAVKEYLNNRMREATGKNIRMSLIVISILEFKKLKQKLSAEKIGAILRTMKGIIKGALRMEADAVFSNSGEMMIILVSCDKKGASRVENRLRETLDKYLTNQKILQKINLRFGSAVYPDDAKNDDQLIKKAKEA
jgi:signal transduction histidine kinase/GGDEF domain-containing protein